MKLAVLGAGDVGTAVVEIAEDFGHTVSAFADSESAAVDDDGIDVQSVLERKQTGENLGDDDPALARTAAYDVLVEATPTTLDDAEPAFSHTRDALQRDRHVVLANKGPVALRYQEVRDIARESDGTIRFGATIGGAIPVISSIEDIGRSHISVVRGALDGTANFILSRMAAEGLDYEHVLAEAKELGVVEADPTFQVDGIDTALKALIIGNLLWPERTLSLSDVDRTGIEHLPGSLLDLAKEDGSTIRLIAEIHDGTIRVGPRLVSENSPIAPSGSINAVQFQTRYGGRLNLSGRGTGGLETASTVLSDVNKIESLQNGH